MVHMGAKYVHYIHQGPFLGKEGPRKLIIRIGLVIHDLKHSPLYEK